jgi:2-iminobutanoate/2-iminopropanoate deaminase
VRLSTEQAPSRHRPYSQATIAGGFLFTAGQIPLDPATMEIVGGDDRSRRNGCWRTSRRCWRRPARTWQNVVKTTVFLQDMAGLPAVQVAALPRGVSVEVELIAKLP